MRRVVLHTDVLDSMVVCIIGSHETIKHFCLREPDVPATDSEVRCVNVLMRIVRNLLRAVDFSPVPCKTCTDDVGTIPRRE